MNMLLMLIVSVSPFAFGFALNKAMMTFDLYGNATLLLSLLFAVYWTYAGYKSYEITGSAKSSVIAAHSFAFLSIGSVFFQLLVYGRYAFGWLGTLPQFFYLPMVRLTAIVQINLMFFVRTHYTTVTYVLSLLLMIAFYYAGYVMRQKRV